MKAKDYCAHNCLKTTCLFVLCFILTMGANAQTSITGTVKNEAGLPIQNVNVQVKNFKVGTKTDKNGQYTIPVLTKYKTLVFTSVGHIKVEVSIAGKTVLNVTMNTKVSEMDEVVVTGYTSTMRKDLTGAIGTVKMDELKKAPVGSFEEALAGRVAGVQVTSESGKPGDPINIVIRGVGSISQSNAPLFVIDGFPIENPDNSLIDPDNIASINVLKDASSTALYGARGSNGVIVITTKRGERGRPKISLSSSYGINRIPKMLKLLSPYEFVKMQSELLGATNPYFNDGSVLEDYRNVKGVDWQDMLLRTGHQQNHSISLRGGSGGTVYSMSGNYFEQEGILINSGYRRYQGKMTIDQTVGERAKIGGSVTYTNSKVTGTNPTANGPTSLFYHAYSYRPISVDGIDDRLEESLYDPDNNGVADYRANPIMSAEYQVRNSIKNNVISNLYIEYNIFKTLTLRLRGGANNIFTRSENFNGSKTRTGGEHSSTGLNGSLYNSRYDYYDNTNLLDYRNTFNKVHHLNIVAGNSIQKTNYQSWGYSAYQIPDESLGLSGIDAGIINTPPSGRITYNSMASWLGSMAYNYDGKYYVTANFRADGSSKFIGDNKWGYFPSGAIKWKFSKEKIFKEGGILSDGNIRFSYGITGNNRIGDFDTYSIINFNSPLTLNGVTQPNSAVISSLQNPSLRWESTEATDLGIDLGFFDNRLGLIVDLYKRTTNDLLYRTQLPTSTGYTSSVKNIAGISNRGIEITLDANVVQTKNFSYNSTFNISFNRNKLEALSDPNETGITSTVSWEALFRTIPAYIAEIGGPLGQIYGLISDGLYQYSDFDQMPNGSYVLKGNVPANTIDANRSSIRPGDNKFVDINNDGQITDDDKVVIGNGYPIHTGGWSNSFKYKNFDLNIFFQWSYGNNMVNANRIWFEPGMGIQQRGSFMPGQNAFAEYANRWTPENQNTTVPKLNRTRDVYATQYVEDASYLRLKTLNVGYTFPGKFLLRNKISLLRIYIATNNIYTWTKYKGYDPEVSAFHTALTPGFDYSIYPRPFTITGGINLSF